MWKLNEQAGFPFLFGGTFIEGYLQGGTPCRHPAHFPSFSEGLSLRAPQHRRDHGGKRHFPSFSEGLSLRGTAVR